MAEPAAVTLGLRVHSPASFKGFFAYFSYCHKLLQVEHDPQVIAYLPATAAKERQQSPNVSVPDTYPAEL